MKTTISDTSIRRVRDLQLSDIPELANLAPECRDMALDTVLLQHAERDYYYARVVTEGDLICGVGQGIRAGKAGWIGNIVVRAESRSRGIGTQITVDLVNRLHHSGCNSLLLIASPLGEPVYSKLGFRKTDEYIFYGVPRIANLPTAHIRRVQRKDFDRLFELDTFATGEVREGLLAPHLDGAWAHTDGFGRLDGFFLPTLGSGPVIAAHTSAGIELLGFKNALHPGTVVVPAGNKAAIRFLTRRGAAEIGRAPRMVLGGEVTWRPECVFSRASGYCG